MSTKPDLGLVDTAQIPDYPIGSDERLDSHFYVELHFRRWLNSRFCLLADDDVCRYGFNLFFIAQDQTPVGTLPEDDLLLAKYLKIDLAKWQSLRDRTMSPLYNWSRVRCDNGEIRLAHPVVTEMAQKALAGRRKHAENASKARERKRLKDLCAMVERIGAKQVLRNPGYIERLDAWLIENRGDRNRTEPVVREGMEAIE